eukprot:Sspe_Gene.31834::Locus_15658_Transcript_1_1_Confidence_1.000_Length_2279::g.31834::m.31834
MRRRTTSLPSGRVRSASSSPGRTPWTGTIRTESRSLFALAPPSEDRMKFQINITLKPGEVLVPYTTPKLGFERTEDHVPCDTVKKGEAPLVMPMWERLDDRCASSPDPTVGVVSTTLERGCYSTWVRRRWMGTDACGANTTVVGHTMVVEATATFTYFPQDIVQGEGLTLDPDHLAGGRARSEHGCGPNVLVGYTDTNSTRGVCTVVSRNWTAFFDPAGAEGCEPAPQGEWRVQTITVCPPAAFEDTALHTAPVAYMEELRSRAHVLQVTGTVMRLLEFVAPTSYEAVGPPAGSFGVGMLWVYYYWSAISLSDPPGPAGPQYLYSREHDCYLSYHGKVSFPLDVTTEGAVPPEDTVVCSSQPREWSAAPVDEKFEERQLYTLSTQGDGGRVVLRPPSPTVRYPSVRPVELGGDDPPDYYFALDRRPVMDRFSPTSEMACAEYEETFANGFEHPRAPYALPDFQAGFSECKKVVTLVRSNVTTVCGVRRVELEWEGHEEAVPMLGCGRRTGAKQTIVVRPDPPVFVSFPNDIVVKDFLGKFDEWRNIDPANLPEGRPLATACGSPTEVRYEDLSFRVLGSCWSFVRRWSAELDLADEECDGVTGEVRDQRITLCNS